MSDLAIVASQGALCALAHRAFGLRRVGFTCVCGKSLQTRDSNPYPNAEGTLMNSIIYIVGAVVIIFAILSFLGLR
jgi:hypothetical protein